MTTIDLKLMSKRQIKNIRAKAIKEVFDKLKRFEQKAKTEKGKFIPETSYVILTWEEYLKLKKKFGAK